MKRAAGTILAILGLIGVAWPFPLFTLNEPWVSQYLSLIDWINGVPPGAVGMGTAYVFLWFFITMPAGLAMMVIGALLIHRGKERG